MFVQVVKGHLVDLVTINALAVAELVTFYTGFPQEVWSILLGFALSMWVVTVSRIAYEYYILRRIKHDADVLTYKYEKIAAEAASWKQDRHSKESE